MSQQSSGEGYESLIVLALDKGVCVIRDHFERAFKQETGAEWRKAPLPHTNKLFKQIRLYPLQKEKWNDFDKWDTTLLCNVLLNSDWKKKASISDMKKKALRHVREVRGVVSHTASCPLSYSDFETNSKKLIAAYEQLGMENALVKGIKRMFEKKRSKWGLREKEVEHTLEAHLLLSDGLEAEEKHDIDLAISFYSEATEKYAYAQPGTVAACYGGRARCLFERKKFLEAEIKVNEAIRCDPFNGEWQVLLARSLKAQHKYKEAVVAFEKGFGLFQARDPDFVAPEELMNELDVCKAEAEVLKYRYDESAFYSLADRSFRTEEEFNVRNNATTEEIVERSKMFLPPGPALVVEGHQLKEKERFKEAYVVFRRAYEEHGDGEGAFLVGHMHGEGIYGFPQNYKLANEWYEKAISCKPRTFQKVKRKQFYGIGDAHNALGLNYRNGVGVKKDYQKAFQHFSKSAEMDHGGGSQKLGMMCMEGCFPFLPQDMERAEDHFRKSWALMGVPEAAHNIYTLFKFQGDLLMALKWAKASKDAGLAESFVNNDIDALEQLISDGVTHFPMPSGLQELFKLSVRPEPFAAGKPGSQSDMEYVTNLLNDPDCANTRYEKRYGQLMKGIAESQTIIDAAKWLEQGGDCFNKCVDSAWERLESLLRESPHLQDTAAFAAVEAYIKKAGPGDIQSTIASLESLVDRFPNEVSIWYRLATLLSFGSKKERILPICDKVMSLAVPSSGIYCDMLYIRAFVLEKLYKKKEAVVEYEKFLSHKEADGHPNYPIACFAIAWCILDDPSRIGLSRSMARQGMEANKKLLSLFQVDSDNDKLVFANFVLNQSSIALEQKVRGGSILDPDARVYPQTLHREELLRFHTQSIASPRNEDPDLSHPETPPSLDLKIPFITIDDMQTNVKEHVFTNSTLRCVIVSPPLLLRSWMVYVEDCHRSVIRVALHGLSKENEKKLQIGQVLEIMNPRTRFPANGNPLMIRVDGGVSTVAFKDNVPMCHFCSLALEPGKMKRCGKCKQARYCTEKCQELDWKSYSHKELCGSAVSRSSE